MEVDLLRIDATTIIRAVLPICLAAGLAVPTFAAESSAPSAMPEPVERSSADDCAIIVELGKKQLGWGATPPDAAFYREWPRSGGGTYLEECPWKELGVAAPLEPAQAHDKSFFIKRPQYSGQQATVVFEFSVGKTADGQKLPPFIHGQTCTFKKDNGNWLLIECKTDYIT